MKIHKKDLKNMLRHAYLCGRNSSITHEDEEEWIEEREQDIKDLIKEQKFSGTTCYNDEPCRCSKKKRRKYKLLTNQ